MTTQEQQKQIDLKHTIYAYIKGLGTISGMLLMTENKQKFVCKFDDGVVVSARTIKGIVKSYNSKAYRAHRNLGDHYCPIQDFAVMANN